MSGRRLDRCPEREVESLLNACLLNLIVSHLKLTLNTFVFRGHFWCTKSTILSPGRFMAKTVCQFFCYLSNFFLLIISACCQIITRAGTCPRDWVLVIVPRYR